METKTPKRIPERDWIWMGHPAHFCGANECQFRLTTKVGRFIISTVGDYYPRLPGRPEKRETIGGGDSDFFETFVFKAKDKAMKGCGCFPISDLGELEGRRWATAKEAMKGHIKYCREYATKVTK